MGFQKIEIVKEIKNIKEKIEEYDNLIKNLMSLLKNEWVPCPYFSFLEEEEKVEKIFSEIPKNSLEIVLESCDYENKNAYIWVGLSKLNIFLLLLSFSFF